MARRYNVTFMCSLTVKLTKLWQLKCTIHCYEVFTTELYNTLLQP